MTLRESPKQHKTRETATLIIMFQFILVAAALVSGLVDCIPWGYGRGYGGYGGGYRGVGFGGYGGYGGVGGLGGGYGGTYQAGPSGVIATNGLGGGVIRGPSGVIRY